MNDEGDAGEAGEAYLQTLYFLKVQIAIYKCVRVRVMCFSNFNFSLTSVTLILPYSLPSYEIYFL